LANTFNVDILPDRSKGPKDMDAVAVKRLLYYQRHASRRYL